MEVLESVSYDQYRNIPSYEDLHKKVKIIFSNLCYKNILQMSINAMNNNCEHGSFFVGKIISNNPEVIYFDYNTSEFVRADGPMGKGKAVIPSEQNYYELNSKIREYETKKIKPVVLHFHSHPHIGYYESFSDQDLQSYAKMQVQNPNCLALGMLGFPINETNETIGMCIVRPENPKLYNSVGTADFVRCEDICYLSDNDIYKVGGFVKRYNNRLYQQNLNRKIVKQYLTLPLNGKVCAEGIDPNTHKIIVPSCVGYIDYNNYLNFPDENLSLDITDILKNNGFKISR